MARTAQIDWLQELEWTADVRRALASPHGAAGQHNLHELVAGLRLQRGFYMLLESWGFESKRDRDVREWRRQCALRAFRGRFNVVYIGIVKADQRDFVQRMQEHEKAWLWKYRRAGHLYVRFGVLQNLTRFKDPEQTLEDAESVLIYETQPYENTAKTFSYTVREPITVRNSGEFRPLEETLSSRREFVRPDG